MLCPKCGSENAETFKFCRVCGAPLTVQSAEEKPAEPKPEAKKPETDAQPKPEAKKPEAAAPEKPQGAPVYTSQPGFGGAGGAVKTDSTAHRAVKQIRSPLTLIMILAFTAGIVMALYAYFQGGAQVDVLVTKFGDSRLDVNLSGVSLISGIISQIPSILICIGMWLVYISALRNKPGDISTAGITIIKVILIIGFILACIAAAVAILGMVGIIGFGEFAFMERMPELQEAGLDQVVGIASVAGVILLVLTAAVLVLTILFFIKTMGTLNWTRAQLKNEISRRCPSMYVAVILFIFAACTVLAMVAAAGVVSIAAAVGLPDRYVDALSSIMPFIMISVISGVLQAGFCVLAGVQILKLRQIRNS